MSTRMFTGRTLVVAAATAALCVFAGSAAAATASQEIAKAAQNPNLWPSPGRDLSITRYSPLKQIDTKNVEKLQMVWAQSTSTLRGHEGQPLVVEVDGKPMMYTVSAWSNIVQALDLSNPDHPTRVWKYVKKTDRDASAVPHACCDVVNRGAVYANGSVIFGTLDGYLISLNAKTGKAQWIDKIATPEKGQTLTMAPVVAHDNVIIGYSGNEFGVRGEVMAFNIKTGKSTWHFYNNGPAAEVGMTKDTNKDVPKHGTTKDYTGPGEYPKGEYKRGGGTIWGWGSYDPKLNLVYFGTGNPGTWSPSYRCKFKSAKKCATSGKQDNKWSMSLTARNADTGKLVWAYQMTPFDQWDYDGINGTILVNMDIDGQKNRPVLVHFDRNGFVYVLDRTDGKLLRAHKYVHVNWAKKIDVGGTDRPVRVLKHSPFKVGVTTQACPSAMGGKDQQPASVDPNDPEVFYVPTNNWCMKDTPQERTTTQQGNVYVFANVFMYEDVPGVAGRLKAFNVKTGKALWDIPDPYPNWSGTMTTAGGLVFYGSLNGDFRAVSRKTGKVLWQRRLGSGIIGNPISYKIDGKQYVSIYAGIGGWIGLPVAAGLDLNDKYGAIGATAMAKATGLNHIPQGQGLYTFRLIGAEGLKAVEPTVKPEEHPTMKQTAMR
ncbi:MAG: PQQ-dependent dehydrogenase, methanol/ethanol family [Sinobacteraceae bacterium]|nr:PQQ-dependent dehydrogenase, methanol/ethanol family [Nevskiaceae bacterium]